MAGDPVNVRAPDRDVKGSLATPKFSPLHAARAANSGECHNPGMGTAPTGHNFTAWTHFPPEWSAAPVAPSFPDRPPPSTLSDDRRIPPARCPCAPQAREIPRPAPDAYSAGTRNRGGAVHKVTAPPHHSAPRDRRSTRTRRLGACKGRPPYAPSKVTGWRNGSSRSTTYCTTVACSTDSCTTATSSSPTATHIG